MATAPRDHGRVLCKIWRDKDFRALPRTAQTLYMQLLSQDNVNNAGVLPLMTSKWVKGCDELTPEELLRDLAVLIDASFVVVDTDAEEVLIRSFIRNDGGMKHPYIFKNALRCAQAVESEKLRRVLASELRRTRRAEALRVADVLDPPEPVSVPEPMPSESVPNDIEIPSEWHSEPIALEQHSNGIANPSESGMAFESHSNHYGVGEGEGVGETPVVGHLGGVARAGARDAHTREENPTPQTTPNDIPSSPFCERHPNGTPDPCGACQSARKRYEATAPERAEAEAAQRRVEAQAKSEAAQRAAEDRARAIAACGICDDDGQIIEPGQPPSLCDHRPAPRNRPGLREQFEALKRDQRAAAIAGCELCDEHGARIPPRELRDADPPAVDCDHTPAMPEAWRAIRDRLLNLTEETETHV
ncbi:hypothetical protein B7C42_01610 [Nocardia cerradoensis]|uniref:Uncharacterized protein n=1 Tax=Nocardia cerradoensis TaxID=85688 RepID=A0A231HCW2_9NOCA|nr:hypothetical protein [Nocardia cerradoensis]OXR46636.1 hypothetical protein B7C42_01610 [Nocardia cerradoensis]